MQTRTVSRLFARMLTIIPLIASSTQAQEPAKPAPAPTARSAKPATPPKAPVITAVDGRVVDGISAEKAYKILVKVYPADHSASLSRDAVLDGGDFTAALKAKVNPGDIVQAFLVVNNVETAGSVPWVVPPAPAPAPAAPPVVATVVGPCDAGSDKTLAAPSVGNVAAGDASLSGNAVLLTGTVSVCNNGTQLDIAPTADGTKARTITFTDGKYAAYFTSTPVKENDTLRVVVQSTDKKQRLTGDATVPGPALFDLTKPCDSAKATKGLGPITFDPVLRDKMTDIAGTAPIQDGKIAACRNGTELTWTAASSEAIAKGKFGATLASAVQSGWTVTFVATSTDGKFRVSTPADIADLEYTQISFDPTSVTEGSATITVNGDKSASQQYSLEVFENGSLAALTGSSGATVYSVPADASGTTQIKLQYPLAEGQRVQVVEFETGKTGNVAVGPDSIVQPNAKLYAASSAFQVPSFFNFGRVRAHLAGGTVLSYTNGNFSQPSLFMALNVDKNWRWGGPIIQNSDGNTQWQRWMFNTFFEARLTSVPVASCSTPVGAASSSTPSQSGCPAAGSTPLSTSTSVIGSPAAGELIGGAVIPMIVTHWKFRSDPYALTVGPLAKVNLITPVGSQSNGAYTPATASQFYTGFGFGTRLGFQRLAYAFKEPKSKSNDEMKNISPDTISYIDIISGRFSNFDVPLTDADGKPLKTPRPWRFAIEGILQVPSTPFFVGFSANVHQNFGLGKSTTVDHARDDLRFLFGAKFDAAKLIDAVGKIR